MTRLELRAEGAAPYNVPMLVRDASEFDLIEALSQALPSPPPGAARGLRIGIGDDAAAWSSPEGATVLTTDTLVEGVHFDLDWTGWADLGWKALAVNLSDVAAMGCASTYAVVTLGLRGDLPVDGLTAMYGGIAEAAGLFGCAVVGGDITASPALFVSVAMLGSRQGRGGVLTRTGAVPGQAVAVTGRLGSSAAGLRLLRSGAPQDGPLRRLVDAHLRPQPRLPEGQAIADASSSAAIDVSDGLVADLAKLCAASGVGAEIDASAVPVDPALAPAFPEDWLELALDGGEDYELLFTAPAKTVERIAGEVDTPVTVIGRTVDPSEGVKVLDASGAPIDLPHEGWDHLESMRGPIDPSVL